MNAGSGSRIGRQRALSFGAALALCAMLLAWLAGGGHRGNLIDLDAAPRSRPEYRVDINRASWPELSQISGVGETLARRIVRYRDEHGPFREAHELQHVHGLGPKLLVRMQAHLFPLEANYAP